MTFMSDVVSMYVELHKDLVQIFLSPWHVQDCLNGIKKATKVLSTGVNFIPHPLLKAQLLSFSPNNQNCFYKIPCLKIVSSSDHIFKTLQ